MFAKDGRPDPKKVDRMGRSPGLRSKAETRPVLHIRILLAMKRVRTVKLYASDLSDPLNRSFAVMTQFKMWFLKNRTPYGVERSAAIDGTGQVLWLVVVKATFSIDRQGKLCLDDEQAPPRLVGEYYGEDGASSLKYETDLVIPKRATDFLVLGHAYAPGGKTKPKGVEVTPVGPTKESCE